ETRAYPLQILTWHEIVNDTVGGVPVSVSYCPLCNSAIAVDRRVGDRVLDFGVSGHLWNSSMVMWDRQTRSLWGHFTAEGLAGRLAGVELETYPVTIAAWSDFRDAHPDALVLSRDTGHTRPYGSNPYPGYDDVSKPPFAFDGEVDGRYAAKTRVLGVELDGRSAAIVRVRLRSESVVPFELDSSQLVAFWTAGTASGLDERTVAEGRDVGSAAVFVPVVAGRELTFAGDADSAIHDVQTGSTWSIFGTAVDGELAGAQLTAVPHVDTFWFAWAAFHPDTAVID
ncbi:MAG: DUF3179 domain-containing protein, partial [Acidimicrobiia bacterium]|nr:DUF3179 domain-containing protein [Acidimicrobiia bacterium]